VAGECYGKKSPVPIHSPLFMIEIETAKEDYLNIKDDDIGKVGVCIVEGSVNM